MSSDPSCKFEGLLRLAGTLSKPDDDDKRVVTWCDAEHILGMSRQQGGGLELFLRGEEIHTSSPLIRRHLRFDHWSRSGGEVFSANRIVFPSDDHFIPVVAFVAEEFLRRGVARSLPSGFAATEPLLEIMLRRIVLTEEEILGLVGELRFLEVLLATAPSVQKRGLALDAWRGHERGARDLSLDLSP